MFYLLYYFTLTFDSIALSMLLRHLFTKAPLLACIASNSSLSSSLSEPYNNIFLKSLYSSLTSSFSVVDSSSNKSSLLEPLYNFLYDSISPISWAFILSFLYPNKQSASSAITAGPL